MPVPGTKRLIRFHAEAAVGSALRAAGHPVASWQVIDVDGVECVVGERLAGRPVRYGDAWSPQFAEQVGNLLADLHRLDVSGHGPLVNEPGRLRGEAATMLDGVCRRWRWAACWPFDGSSLIGHPAERVLPDLVSVVAPWKERLLDAASHPAQVVHSDLHREHLLIDDDGELSGVLDFGAAFAGPAAWDFAMLRWYYGAQASRRVAETHLSAYDLMCRSAYDLMCRCSAG